MEMAGQIIPKEMMTTILATIGYRMGSQDRRGNDNKVGDFFIVLRSPVINHPTPSWMEKN